MRKSELIELLEGIDGDPLVLIASDAEWNRVREAVDVANDCKYDTLDREIYEVDEEDYSEDDHEVEDPLSVVEAIVIYPY